jgi:hypothetical protein
MILEIEAYKAEHKEFAPALRGAVNSACAASRCKSVKEIQPMIPGLKEYYDNPGFPIPGDDPDPGLMDPITKPQL